MTPRERFIAALERRPLTGRVPHFELVFFLTMEAFGKVHPSQRHYGQWDQMEEKERQLHRKDMADLYIATAERYEHSAIFLHPNPGGLEETLRLIDLIREKSGDTYFLMLHGDATFSHPRRRQAWRSSPTGWPTSPEGAQGRGRRDGRSARSSGREALCKHGGLDGFALCSDYCFNTGPFLSPNQFGEFVTPYLARLTKAYRDMGFYVIKHTDGNIMPILDQLVQTEPARPALARPAGRRGHRRGQAALRRQGLPDRQRQLRDAGHRHRGGVRRVRPLLPEARHARRRLHLLHQQLHLHRHAAQPVRADAGCVAEGRRTYIPRR